MKFDQYGRAHCTADELANVLYTNPDVDFTQVFVDDPTEYIRAVKNIFYVDYPLPRLYESDIPQQPVELFDLANQCNWHMPAEYKQLDIAQWLLDQCKTEPELQRIGEELLLFQERNLFGLLRYLKYFVDTMRANNVVWGLGRGSSVASYALYLIGVHKINSIYYDLPIDEFLK